MKHETNKLKKIICPRSKPLFKAKPDVVTDSVFKERLKENFSKWKLIKEFSTNLTTWLNSDIDKRAN